MPGKAIKKDDLKGLCKLFGLAVTGTKPVLQDRIKLTVDKARRVSNIMAIDIGHVNLAFAHIRIDGAKTCVKEWDLIKPDLPVEFSLHKFVDGCRRILTEKIIDPKIEAYCIERQSWRKIGPSNSIPHSILRSISMEIIMFSLLAERIGSSTVLESVSPRAVAECFDLRSGCATLKYQDKKKRTISLVDSWIQGNEIYIPQRLEEMYKQSTKKDDLCDALIMARAYAKWNQNLAKYVEGSKIG